MSLCVARISHHIAVARLWRRDQSLAQRRRDPISVTLCMARQRKQAIASPKVWNHRCWVLGRMFRRQPTRVFCVARNQLLGGQKLDAQTQNQERGSAQWRNAPGTAPEACRPKPQAHGEQKKSQSRPRAWIPGRTNFGCESELVSVKDAHEQVGCYASAPHGRETRLGGIGPAKLQLRGSPSTGYAIS